MVITEAARENAIVSDLIDVIVALSRRLYLNRSAYADQPSRKATACRGATDASSSSLHRRLVKTLTDCRAIAGRALSKCVGSDRPSFRLRLGKQVTDDPPMREASSFAGATARRDGVTGGWLRKLMVESVKRRRSHAPLRS